MIWQELITEVEWDNYKQYQWEINEFSISENQEKQQHIKCTIWCFKEFSQTSVESEQICAINKDKETQTQEADHELT